jgi:hypothetical protein
MLAILTFEFCPADTMASTLATVRRGPHGISVSLRLIADRQLTSTGTDLVASGCSSCENGRLISQMLAREKKKGPEERAEFPRQ